MKDNQEFKVLIVGGGLGGLCLAQGLRKAGLAFRVFERDASPTSRLQGYRLSLNPAGLAGLHANLPADLWAQLQQYLTPQLAGISFVSAQLELRFFKATPAPVDAVNRHGSISRVALRQLLLTGLADHVVFGRQFTHYEVLASGQVRCYFADGSWEEGDVLVGADGTKSLVRGQLLPGSARIDTGVSAIAGQVVLDEATRADFFPPPLGESAVVLDSKPQGLFLASHQLDGQQANHDENYVFWSFLAARAQLPADLETLPAPALLALVDRLTAGWHPRLKRLLTRADPQTVLVLHYKASAPPVRWQTGPVTVLGDAIHSMPPTSGEGANTALQDAAGLCAALVAHQQGRLPLRAAVAQYEDAMLEYAFQAVGNAMKNLRRMVVREGVAPGASSGARHT